VRAVGLLLIALVATPAAGAAPSPTQQLADKYAPIAALRAQQTPCGSYEAYRPTTVDGVLNNASVLLRDPGGKVVKRAPTATDLYGLGEGYYLDLPGDPLKPGCGYERDFRRWNGGRVPTTYAHLAKDPDHPGKLAMQYWLYYTFNDFSDKHEGDWEMAQVDFEASSAEEALTKAPYEVDLAQHAGGERSEWTDPKLEKQGKHPVIHVATGSHADYFGSELYLGRGASEGFGCDDTRDSDTRIQLQTNLLPDVPASRHAPDAWLAFTGRWGQKEKGINNGPTGPATKVAWSAPIEWADSLRDSSVAVPGTKTVGPSVTNFFCGAVSQGSIMLNWALVHPIAFVILLALVVAGMLAAARRTTWRPPDPRPLRARRGGGQIVRASRRLYRSRLPTFIAMGVIFVPVSIVAAGIQWVLFHVTSIESLVALDGRHGAVTAFLALVVGGLGGAIASVVTTAAVAATLREIDTGREITAREAFGRAFDRARPLAGAALRNYAVLIVLSVTVIGLPFAIYRFIRWSLYAEACMLEDRSGADSLARSSELVQGRWWRTFGFTAFVDILAAASGPVIGVVLLLVTDRSLNFINIAGSFVYTVTVPWAAIALTLYYFDLQERGAVSAA
jgi:hypothetical protein